MTDVYQKLELLFDRPNEPIVTPKGDQGIVFNLGDDLPDDLLNNRFGDDPSISNENRVTLTPLSVKPNFPLASQLPVDADFSLFIPKHQEMADEVINVLMSVPTNELEDFLSTCVLSRANLNPQLFHYAFSVALVHREDTKLIKLPNYAESFPSKFVNSGVFLEARQNAAVVPKDLKRPIITIPRNYTATDLEVEHRLAYFREDLGINLHHWHWHLVYPFRATHQANIVNKDRRGELFYFMHQQIIARYNCERLNNQLERVKKFSNWREPIPEAYYPKLDNLTSSRSYPPRQSNMRWQDLDRPVDSIHVSIADMERWRKNVLEAIDTGVVILPDGSRRSLDINTLGNMVEASQLSPNPERYGSLHNNGHSFTAYIHDPNHRYLESFNVMADEAITMRDPFFYRWHGFIDDLFQKHKDSAYVRSYTASELSNPGVEVTSLNVVPRGGTTNELNTFWMTSDVDLSRGLDFTDRGPVYARFTHLNHVPFHYDIRVNNKGQSRRTTVRIFMAPKTDVGERPWRLSDQRKMFIEMDKFVILLKNGQNRIIRQSSQSSVTIPFEQTFRDLSSRAGGGGNQADVEFNFCGCGWPQHMLVPKGRPGGAPYVLFVMLSNYDLDRVDQVDVNRELSCKEASSYCGLRDRLYPDRRAMGFPFDRPSRTATTLQDFLTDNMAVIDISIKFNDTVVNNPRNP